MRLLVNKHHDSDPVWHVQITVIGAIILQYLLPDRFVAGSKYINSLILLILLFMLMFTTPRKGVFESLSRRINVIFLALVLGITNIYSLEKVASSLIGKGVSSGRELILTAINIYLTNIVVFGLIYWEMDGGGPGRRRVTEIYDKDFLFPQANFTFKSGTQWHPTFIDYLYVSSTNATAFSPTDTLPLTRRAKMLMLVQALVSLITIGLIVGRAVNILK